MPELVIVNGEEEFLKERAAEDEAQAHLSHEVLRFRPDELPDYIEASQTVPVFGAPRAFILFDSKVVPDLPCGSSDLLIVVSKGSAKLSDPRAKRVHDFPELKAFDDRNDYVSWILKEGNRIGLDLEHVAGALFVNSGRSLRKISSEIRKLAVLSSGGSVSAADAKSVICFSADLTPKGVVDSVCEGNPSRALAYYDKLMEAGDEVGWIIAYMQRHVLQQLRMERLHASGAPAGDSAKILGVHPFVFKKMRESRLGLWSEESLRCSFEVLCSLDLSHKSGSPLAGPGLEIEIIRLSEEARNVYRARNR